MTDPAQALRQCAAQLNRAKTKAAELEHASRAGWAKVSALDEENQRLRAANLDCVDHFNAIKAERDGLLAALKELLDNPAGDYDTTDGYENAVKRAKAAIAKAQA